MPKTDRYRNVLRTKAPVVGDDDGFPRKPSRSGACGLEVVAHQHRLDRGLREKGPIVLGISRQHALKELFWIAMRVAGKPEHRPQGWQEGVLPREKP